MHLVSTSVVKARNQGEDKQKGNIDSCKSKTINLTYEYIILSNAIYSCEIIDQI